MKRTILIATGVIIILIIAALWAYLMLNGSPTGARDIFGNFGNSGEGEDFGSDPQREDGENVGVSEGTPLKQLTTRPVAGAVILGEAVRYVERGTGHVYEVPIMGGGETLVSNTTIPQAITASFSANGSRVAIGTQKSDAYDFVVGEIKPSETSIEGVSLPHGTRHIAWNGASNILYYLLDTAGGSGGYAYDPITNTSTLIFDIPLRDVRVLWGEPVYVYTTPTARQTGYVYRIEDSRLQYVGKGAPGLMAIPYSKGIAVTTVNENRAVTRTDETSAPLPVVLLPEKCVQVPGKDSQLYCASPSTQPAGDFPDAWYKGTQTLSDQLWLVDVDENRSTVLSSFLDESGREIDVSQIGTDTDGMYIYFVNKNDGTLWVFDTTQE